MNTPSKDLSGAERPAEESAGAEPTFRHPGFSVTKLVFVVTDETAGISLRVCPRQVLLSVLIASKGTRKIHYTHSRFRSVSLNLPMAILMIVGATGNASLLPNMNILDKGGPCKVPWAPGLTHGPAKKTSTLLLCNNARQ